MKSSINDNQIKICVGIVLYNPEIKLLQKNIESIMMQSVDSIYLYDNASTNQNEIKCLLTRLQNDKKIVYERGEKNLGISQGLNKILYFAKSNEYDWFLTLDQDSICSENLIESYLKLINKEKIAIVCPVILNNGKRTIEDLKSMKLLDFEYIDDPVDCITSASLNNTTIISKLGGYKQELFIDCVDSELNCRIFLAGYKIIRSNKCFLIQHMGDAKGIAFFSFLYKITKIDIFRRMQVASVYSDKRLYYISRNSAVVRKLHNNYGPKLRFSYIFALFCYFSVTYPITRSRFYIWKSFFDGYRDSYKFIKK